MWNLSQCASVSLIVTLYKKTAKTAMNVLFTNMIEEVVHSILHAKKNNMSLQLPFLNVHQEIIITNSL